MITREKIQQIITNAITVFGKCEWFRDITVYPTHPTTNAPTIEFKVNYVPIFEKKNVIAFSEAAGTEYFFTVVDRDGKKVE